MKILNLIISIFFLSFVSFSQVKLISPNATLETQALFRNLKNLSKENILFGHHDANAYGHSWIGIPNKSDVKDVCGSHPAVYGCDFASITRENTPKEQVENETGLRKRIIEVYNRGSVNTVTWHSHNPVNNGSFYYKDNPIKAVPLLIPGGQYHEQYKKILQTIAVFAKSIKGENGELIPLIFRPFHEYEGDWFWWGVPHHCSKEEFLKLWKFTITYLKDDLGVTNFIYAISPDCRFNSRDEFLEYYPGDEYVDLIGMDNYWDFRPDGGSLEAFSKKIKIVSDEAITRNKVAALTETGLEGIPDPVWWTKTLLRLLKNQKLELSYVMVWRNAYDNPTHYYAPFPGQVSAKDFIKFRKDKYTLFENDLDNIYK